MGSLDTENIDDLIQQETEEDVESSRRLTSLDLSNPEMDAFIEQYKMAAVPVAMNEDLDAGTSKDILQRYSDNTEEDEDVSGYFDYLKDLSDSFGNVTNWEQAATFFKDKPEYPIVGPSEASFEVMSSDEEKLFETKKEVSYRLSDMSDSRMALDAFKSWFNRNNGKKIDSLSAQQIAKEHGVDIKFDRDTNIVDVYDSIFKKQLYDEYQNQLALIEAAGAKDLGAMKNLSVFWAGIRGGFSWVDLGLGFLGGGATWLAIKFAAWGAKGLLAARSLAIGSKIAHVNRAAKTAKTATALSTAAAADNIMAKTTLEQLGNLSTGFWGKVQRVSGWKYGNMTWLGKGAGDATAFALVDWPVVQGKLRYSKNKLQWDLYSELDRNIELAAAFGLGAVVPGAVRAIGATSFKNLPESVWSRKFNEKRRAVANDLKKGKITEDEAIKRVKDINETEKTILAKLNKGAKARTKVAEQQATMDKVVMGSETFQALMEYIKDCIREGKQVDLKGMPKFESLLTNITREALERILGRESVKEVMGSFFEIAKSKWGTVKAKVGVDGGMLASRSVAALTEKEADDLTGKLYRGMLELVTKGVFSDEMREFIAHARSFDRFSERVEGIINRFFVDAKSPAKSLSKDAIRKQLYNAFIEYKMQGDIDKIRQYKSLIREKARLNSEVQSKGVLSSEEVINNKVQIPEEWSNFETEFYEWFDTIKDLNKENVLELVDDLKTSAEGNNYLSRLNEVIGDIEYARISEEKSSTIKLEPEDMQRVLEITRLKEQYMDESPDTLSQRNIRDSRAVSKIRLKMAAIVNSEAFSGIYKFIRNYRSSEGSGKTSTVQFHMPRVFEMIEDIQHFLNPRLLPEGKEMSVTMDNVGAHFMDALISSKAFTKFMERLTSTLAEGGQEAFNKEMQHSLLSYKYSIQELVVKSLEKVVPGFEYFTKTELGKLTSKLTDSLLADIQKNPKLAQWLATPEAERQALLKGAQEAKEGLGVLEGTPLGMDVERRLAEAAEQVIEPEKALAGFKEELTSLLNRLELTMSSEAINFMELISDMLANPSKGAEVVTSRATSSHELWGGAALSTENRTKGAYAFVRALESRLREMGVSSNNSSKSLLEIFKKANKETTRRVNEILTRRRWGEDVPDNSDEARIATAIADTIKALDASFAKHGLSYTDNVVALDSHKLANIASQVSDQEVSEMVTDLSSKIDVNENTSKILSNAERDENALYKSGDRFIPHKKAVATVVKALKDINNELKDLVSVANPYNLRTALMLFRDMDLDRIFVGEGGIRALPLNEVRDAILNGNLAEYIGNDVYRAKQTATAVKEIVSKIIGRKKILKAVEGDEYFEAKGYSVRRKDDLGRVIVSATSRAATFRPGQRHIKAREEGTISGALADYEGLLHFKDAETEIKYLNRFGYDSLENQVAQTLKYKANILYSFENFGLNPVRTAREAMEIFNAMQSSDPSTMGYRTKLIEEMYGTNLSEGRKRGLEKRFFIRESQKNSVIQNVKLATGLGDSAMSASTAIAKTARNFMTAGKVIAAGISSLADVGIMHAQLVATGYASSGLRGLMSIMKSYKDIWTNRDALDLFVAATILKGEEFTKLFSGEFTTEIMDQVAVGGWAEALHNASLKFSELLLNKVGMLHRITMANKKASALAIQMSVGAYKNKSWKDLGTNLQGTLRAEGVEEFEWDFIRTHLIVNADELSPGLGSRDIFIPQKILEKRNGEYVVTDEHIREALKKGGYDYITQETIDEFREEMLNRTWLMVDNEADTMVSIPNSRVLNAMRLNHPNNSGIATVLETALQFKSFAFTATYNMYGRQIQRAMANLPGHTIWDFFDPRCRTITADARFKLAGGLITMYAIAAPWELATQLLKQKIQGKEQDFITEDGKLASSWCRALLNPAYALSDVFAVMYDILSGNQTAGAALASNTPPILSAIESQIKRGVIRPFAKSLDKEDRPASFAAGVALNVIDTLGLARAPFTAWAVQNGFMEWLEFLNRGPRAYKQYLKQQEAYGYDVEDRSYYPKFGEGFKRMFRR